MLIGGHGVIVTGFFDAGESRTLPWARRAEAAALVAALADPDRGWDAIVIGEYERAFYGNQYALMAPLFEHYGGRRGRTISTAPGSSPTRRDMKCRPLRCLSISSAAPSVSPARR
jgi:hypothetical protein